MKQNQQKQAIETSNVGLLPTLPRTREYENVKRETSSPMNDKAESRNPVGTAHLLNVDE